MLVSTVATVGSLVCFVLKTDFTIRNIDFGRYNDWPYPDRPAPEPEMGTGLKRAGQSFWKKKTPLPSRCTRVPVPGCALPAQPGPFVEH